MRPRRVSREGDDFCISFTDATPCALLEPPPVYDGARALRHRLESGGGDAHGSCAGYGAGRCGGSKAFPRTWSARFKFLRLSIDISVDARFCGTDVHERRGVTRSRRSACGPRSSRPRLRRGPYFAEGAHVPLKPVDDVHASSLVVPTKDTATGPRRARKGVCSDLPQERRCACATFKATQRTYGVGTGRGVEARDQRAADEVRERRYYSKGPLRYWKWPGRPGTLASVSVNDDDMGSARGTRDVEAADATLSTAV